MATTVKQLIGYLQEIKNQDQPVFYQYLLAEHTTYGEEKFAQLVDIVEESSADNISNYMFDELADGERFLEEEEEPEE